VRPNTIFDIDKAGFDLRLWCYSCCRGSTVDGIVWAHFQERGLSLKIDEVRNHFPCRQCGARDCLILPATATGPRPKDALGIAVTWFFAARSTNKGHAPKATRPREFGLAGARAPAKMKWPTVTPAHRPPPRLRLIANTGSRRRKNATQPDKSTTSN
jgi:hypothetical protein